MHIGIFMCHFEIRKQSITTVFKIKITKNVLNVIREATLVHALYCLPGADCKGQARDGLIN